MGFFEAQEAFLKLVNPENPDSFDQNLENHPDLVFREPAFLMANVKLADQMELSEFLNFDSLSKCELDFEVKGFDKLNFSHQKIGIVRDQDFHYLEIFYTDNTAFDFGDDNVVGGENYKMYFYDTDLNKNPDLDDNQESPDYINKKEVERELYFNIQNNQLGVKTEQNGCVIEQKDKNRDRNFNLFDLIPNIEISFVPMICSNKNEFAESDVTTLNSEKCELVDSESNFIIKNNMVYKNGKKLNKNFVLKQKLIESEMGRLDKDFKNYIFSRCGLMEFCDEIYDSEHKVLYLRCFTKDLIIKKDSKNQIKDTYELRKDNTNNQLKEITFNPNLDRRRILKIYKMPNSKYFFFLGIIFASITIWAVMLLTIPGIFLSLICIFATGICCFFGKINKEYEDAIGKPMEFDTEKMNKRRRKRILASSSDIINKNTKAELKRYKNNILKTRANLENKLKIFREINKKSDNSYKNSPMFYTEIGLSLQEYKDAIIPDLVQWTAEEENNINFSEDILEGSNINTKASGGLNLPQGVKMGKNNALFEVTQIPDHISSKPDNSMNMLNIQRIKPRKKNFETGVVEKKIQKNNNDNWEDFDVDDDQGISVPGINVQKKKFLI